MRELLPTLIAVNTVVANPAGGGDAQSIVMDFGSGDGARIIGVEMLDGDDGTAQITTYGVSVDPNATAPASANALVVDPDVIATSQTDTSFNVEGGMTIQGRFIDLSHEVIIVTRDLSVVGFNTGGSSTVYCRVHYNQVQFTEDELRAITIVNR